MAIEQQIKDLDGQFAGAFNRGDLAALVALTVQRREVAKRSSRVSRGFWTQARKI